MRALLAALLLASPALADDDEGGEALDLEARAVSFEAAHSLPATFGPLRLSLDIAGTRPLDGPGASAGRLTLWLPFGDVTIRAYTQAQPQSDPEIAAAVGLVWRSLAVECVVPELEADPWQEPSTPVGVVSYRAGF